MNIEVCKIHDQPLGEGEAEVKFGYFRFTNEYYRAKERLFPYSRSFQIEGDKVDSFNPRAAKTYFCSSRLVPC